MMSFTELNLNANISKAILACGYTTPTPIQSRSIPDILDKKDLVASAQTGTGKTAAFVLPALHLLSEAKAPNAKPRVLILTPTRELAIQIMDSVAKYSKFMRINMVSLVGGMPYKQQLQGLSRPVDIIVATPGRLIDHMTNRRLDLSGIQMLILDEADRMLDMGFVDDVKEIAKATPSSRQTLLFSATVDNKLSAIIKQLLKDPIRIDLSQAKMAPIQIKQEVYMTDSVQHKIKLLQHFVKNGNIFKAIIFSATKVNADKLTKQFDGEGYSVAALHGDLKQNMRNRTIEAMRRGKIQFLIATDVAARGIDISDITHVINFDLPKFHEDYVHRIGRTGRAGKSGIAISFASPDDGRHLQGIEKFKWITILTIVSKLIYLFGIFFFIHQKSDYIFINLFWGVGTIVANGITFFYIIKKNSFSFRNTIIEEVVSLLKNNFSLFSSQIFVSLQMYAPIMLIGVFGNNLMAGHYKIVEQIIVIFKTYIYLFFNFVYPRICYLLGSNIQKGLRFWKTYNGLNFIFILVSMIVLFLFSIQVVSYFSKSDVVEISNLLQLALLLPIALAISIPFKQLVLGFSHEKFYIRITMVMVVLNLVVMMVVLPYFKIIGVFLTLIVTEVVTILIYYFNVKAKLHLNKTV